jgi:hypothetical protein
MCRRVSTIRGRHSLIGEGGNVIQKKQLQKWRGLFGKERLPRYLLLYMKEMRDGIIPGFVEERAEG